MQLVQLVMMFTLMGMLPMTTAVAGQKEIPEKPSRPATQMSPDVKAIVGLYAKWRQAVEGADIPGYISVLHKDVRLIPPGAEVIAGADNYRRFLGPVFEGASYRIEVVQDPRVDVLGDIAVAEYAYVIHLKLHDDASGIDQAGALTASRTEARYLDVLRKNTSGDWKVWRHTWH